MTKRKLAGEETPISEPVVSPAPLFSPGLTERQQIALAMKLSGESQDTTPAVTPPPTTPRPNKAGQINKLNKHGESPLQKAAIKGDLKQVKFLIKQGAEVNTRDHAGWSPLHEAACKGHIEVCRTLLRSGAQVNVAGYCDETPLHDASNNGHPKVVSLLLQHGADPTLRNQSGKLPSEVTEHPLIKAMLTAALTRSLGDGDPLQAFNEEEAMEFSLPPEEATPLVPATSSQHRPTSTVSKQLFKSPKLDQDSLATALADYSAATAAACFDPPSRSVSVKEGEEEGEEELKDLEDEGEEGEVKDGGERKTTTPAPTTPALPPAAAAPSTAAVTPVAPPTPTPDVTAPAAIGPVSPVAAVPPPPEQAEKKEEVEEGEKEEEKEGAEEVRDMTGYFRYSHLLPETVCSTSITENGPFTLYIGRNKRPVKRAPMSESRSPPTTRSRTGGKPVDNTASEELKCLNEGRYLLKSAVVTPRKKWLHQHAFKKRHLGDIWEMQRRGTPPEPDLPAWLTESMIYTKKYLLQNSVVGRLDDQEEEEEGEEEKGESNKYLSHIPNVMRVEYAKMQAEDRVLRCRHTADKERLLLQHEQSMLRVRRQSIMRHPTPSACSVLVQQHSIEFAKRLQTVNYDINSEQLLVIRGEKVMSKFGELSEGLYRRHKQEADTQFSSHRFSWMNAIHKYGLYDMPILGNLSLWIEKIEVSKLKPHVEYYEELQEGEGEDSAAR